MGYINTLDKYPQYLQERVNALQRGHGVVYFNTDPPGADIYIDGLIAIDANTGAILRTPTGITLLEGTRNFALKLSGYQDETGHVYVIPNTTVDINRVMKSGR